MHKLPEQFINGQNRSIRFLGLSDVFRAQRVMSDAYAGAALRGVSLSLENEESVLGFVSAALAFAEDSMTDWIKSFYLPRLEPEYDPTAIELLTTANLLAEHPDIDAFFEQAKLLLAKVNKYKKVVSPPDSSTQTPSS